MTPFNKRDVTGDSFSFPCGKCPDCLMRRLNGWSFRLMAESRISISSLFVTLTYSTSNVPITKRNYMSLCKRDVQLFMKRLRKRSNEVIKYYVVGEYGGLTSRPHYHALLFNAKVEDIESSWMLGNCHYGMLTEASVGYTLKYMTKEPKIPAHANDDRVREFSLMSKGLGLNYLSKDIVDYHREDMVGRYHLTLKDGRKIAMPRYYRMKIYNEDERKIIGFFKSIEAKRLAVEKNDNLVNEHGERAFEISAEIDMSKIKSLRKKAMDGRDKW